MTAPLRVPCVLVRLPSSIELVVNGKGYGVQSCRNLENVRKVAKFLEADGQAVRIRQIPQLRYLPIVYTNDNESYADSGTERVVVKEIKAANMVEAALEIEALGLELVE